MGANTFKDFCPKQGDETMQQAFSRTVRDYQYQCGHGGYTGTIAEKHAVVYIDKAATPELARERATSLIRVNDSRTVDKWGPAGAIAVDEPAGWLFFGWASS